MPTMASFIRSDLQVRDYQRKTLHRIRTQTSRLEFGVFQPEVVTKMSFDGGFVKHGSRRARIQYCFKGMLKNNDFHQKVEAIVMQIEQFHWDLNHGVSFFSLIKR